MDNLFLAKLFDWNTRPEGEALHFAQRVMRKLGSPWRLERAMNPQRDMTNFAQRANLWHFASQVIAYGVPGDFAEFGCFDGKTAAIFQKVLSEGAPQRRLHVYDHFQIGFAMTGRDIRAELERNFAEAGVPLPVIHEGDFNETVPAQVPAQLAFVHIDCGFGGDPGAHAATVKRLLEHAYPRMAPGAVGVLMDYYEDGRSSGADFNPGAGIAARSFFADKPEKVSALWAQEYTHGYFRKAG